MNSSEERRNVLDKERSKRKKEKILSLARNKFVQHVNYITEDLFWSRECHAQVFSYLKRTQFIQFLDYLDNLIRQF